MPCPLASVPVVVVVCTSTVGVAVAVAVAMVASPILVSSSHAGPSDVQEDCHGESQCSPVASETQLISCEPQPPLGRIRPANNGFERAARHDWVTGQLS